jgi:ferric-chelate reductase [NAD(P)H]
MNNKTFFQISYGVYIITSKFEQKMNGMIATTICQVTSEPIKITATINKQNLTHEYILYNNQFNVSILSEETSLEFIGHFGFRSGRDFDKFRGINYTQSQSGVPIILDNSVGFIEATVIDKLDVGTHTIFVAEAISAEGLSDKSPMTYAYYHKIKGGLSPKAAPTYIIN